MDNLENLVCSIAALVKVYMSVRSFIEDIISKLGKTLNLFFKKFIDNHLFCRLYEFGDINS